MRLIIALMVIASTWGVPPAVLAQDGPGFIACPVEMLEVKPSTAIPSPWWVTPQQGKLMRTEVMAMGGRQVLSCKYWAYGTTADVMREMPAGVKNCQAQGNGFQCQ